ncbi:MAG: hypothetical protein A3D35_02335 [Candidatus Staskawiczbacteria bacterium RIFCSPHIGHO2_02_FULL_34_9]|uniref:Uncharacterized protein n=1 Tax=Candidatus Staskawiczbacteria bacterium RIFCSPHIGHO2_02_FULL_34_9 TaxID=1802206 RepID=A0A1G2I3B7_9BACT|nr:MAG: hypothetical protein A3D35_02335 [Candidatus Staskawiczbacteria bacterium RIFCSPHIGHO2_02_FULL_34_9]
MKTEKIIDNNNILAIIVRSEDWEVGLNFASSDEDFIQAGFWNYEKGKQLLPHIHLEAKREILKTQEVIFVKNGSLRADIFTDEGKLFKSVELHQGDTGVFLNGGHGYEILEEGTQILEVKNGPYVGPEKDRKRI